MQTHRLIIQDQDAVCECGNWQTSVHLKDKKEIRDEIIRRYRKHAEAAEARRADAQGRVSL